MEWPSKRVPHGGLFHPAKASYSPENREFLKVLINESKLSMIQRQKANYSLRSSEPTLQSRSESRLSIREPQILIRPGSSKKRTQNTIVNSGAYVREKFIPKLHVDGEKAKRHLQDVMAFGKDVRPTPRVPKPKPKAKRDEPEENRFDQLVREIQEREEFLKEMQELGEGSKYEVIIEQQIQAKLREMKKLELEGKGSRRKK